MQDRNTECKERKNVYIIAELMTDEFSFKQIII